MIWFACQQWREIVPVNILSVMMNSSVNRLKRWEDNKLDFLGILYRCLAECWIIFGRKME